MLRRPQLVAHGWAPTATPQRQRWRAFFPASARVGLASGAAFPDALASGAFVAHTGAPLILTDPALLPQSTRGYLAGAVTAATIFGGEAAISEAVDTSVLTAVGH